MPISTNSIIHYTKTIENLQGILNEGLKIFYCHEMIHARNGKYFKASFPMVSFCDIPLSDLKEHLDAYGHYGIGLTKKWAMSKGLNPIIYFEKNSNLFNYYRDELERLNKKRNDNKLGFEDLEHLITILGYSKNYEGPLEKTGEKNYRFYNEREWRWVPTKDELKNAPPFIAGDAYLKNKDAYNSKLDNLKLEFSPQDISYIIVKDETEIRKVTRVIRTRFESECSSVELEVLMTKIITTDQIKNDF